MTIIQRDSKGRFAKARWFVWMLLGMAVWFTFNYHFNIWYGQEISFKATPVFAGETLEAKLDEMKEDILNRLAACESGGRNEADGITVLDSNNVGSYGMFQFQRKTVMHYHEKMTGEPINGRDAIILAMTPERARALAKFVIFETESGVAKDWVNCSKWHGLQQEVSLIKKLLAE